MTGSPTQRALVPLAAVLLLVWGFGKLASEIAEGETRAMDEWILRAMRTSDLGEPVGPWWVEEMARDATALGGNVVVTLLVVTVSVWLVRRPGGHRGDDCARWVSSVRIRARCLLPVAKRVTP